MRISDWSSDVCSSDLAYKEAVITDPGSQVSLMEVHDCFSITELVTMEDLAISREGQGWKDVLDGRFDADGKNPCQIDGGLKCFGHPIGASGIRMIRSEEHTSELQSLMRISYAVFCLKKKKNHTTNDKTQT